MALLKVGSKAPVFVTHLEFVGAECQIFCQVGDVGGQADTLAERVHESVENGLASQISECNVGDICLALFHEDGSWYRGKVLQNLGHSLKVFFIDYGNTEIVKVNDIRSAPDYVLAIPALSTKCIVSDCTPLSDVWAEEEKKKIETMLHSGEFSCEIIECDVNKEVYKVKLYSNDASNTPIFVRPAPSSRLSITPQNLTVGQDYEVYVSYVESNWKFWVQLKRHENDLNSLMSDISACFAEDLPSTGDIVNPTEGQVCAACFSDDGAFYRSIVKNIQGSSCTVFFLDYGNKEEKRTSELFTLPQALCQLPIQAVQCSYKVQSPAVEDKLHDLAEDEGPSVLKVLSGNSRSGYVVELNSIEQMLNIPNIPKGTTQSDQTKSAAKPLWEGYTSVAMQVDGIYDVCLSHIDHPGQFFVQLLGNANNLDKLMQAIDEVAHNYDKLTNLYQGYPCLAKFSDGSWYRGEVVSAEVGKTVVAAVDFGFVEVVQPSQLRNTDPNFKLQPAQGVKCTIDAKKTDQNMWTAAEIDNFRALSAKSALVAKVILKKGCIHQVDLYETEKGVERHINTEFLNRSNSVPSRATSQLQPKPQPVSAPILSLPEVTLGSKYKLCFTAVKSLYIYGQLTNTSVEKVAKLQTDLNTFFEKQAGENLLKAEVGSVCCTQYVDGGWYRGIVTSVAGNKAEVAFVDFGDSVMKSVNDLKVLPPTLCGLSQQCILCKIVNLPSAVGPNKLEKLINKRVEVKLNGKEDGVYPTYETEITDRQTLEQFQESPSARPAVFKGASSRTFGRPQKDDSAVSVPRGMPSRKPSGSGYSQQEVAVGSTQEVMVTYVKNPDNFQVVLDKMNSSLDWVMGQLHEFYDKLPPNANKLDNPALGQPCVSQFTEDKGWYRALVTGLKADGQAEVMYVDYGNNEYTEKDALKEIQQQFMSLPAQAVQCRLSGVSSSQGFWSPEHIVQFTEMVEEQSFMATFKSEQREQGQLIYKVELVDKKGININQKFGTMTGTTCAEADTGPGSRSVSAGKFGQTMKVTVVGGREDKWEEGGDSGFGNKSRSFGANRQQSGGSSGFGSRPSGFGSKQGSSEGNGGWDDGGSSETSGFGSKKPFGGGSGFGKSSGFGSRSSGFGSKQSSSEQNGGWDDGGSSGTSGFGSKKPFGSDSGGGSGFGKSSGFGSGGAGFGGGGGGGRDCYKCGESGHMARDCTNPPKGGGGGRDCFKCGESGHMARDCTNPPKAGGFGGGGGRECYKCGESGHMARDCTNPPKAGGGGGGRECYKCGESGHMARDCTNPPKDGAGPRKGFGGGSERPSGGFGNKGGGFGSRGGGFGSQSESTSDSWDDASSKNQSTGGFGAKGGFGSRGSESTSNGRSGGGFGSRGSESTSNGRSGGGFGSRGSESTSNGRSGGGLGSRGGGFGSKSSDDDWGSSGSTFKKKEVGGGDDWGAEVSPSTNLNQVTSPAGDGFSNSKLGNGTELSPLILDTREPVDVYVVYVTNPEQFWCQVMKNCPSLEQLMEEMNTFYNGSSESDLRLSTPEIGMPCAAKFSEDNMWYRAKILTPSQSDVEVQFVDYGNTETVAIGKLKQLKPEYMNLKTQGIKCRLDDVVSVDKIWTQKATDDFEDLTQDKHLVAKVITRSSDLTHVLDLENLDEKMNIAEAMFEKGHCKLRSVKASPVKQQIVKNPYPSPSIQTGQEIDVYVSWIENPEMFWVQLVSEENELSEFVEKIQEVYTSGAGADMKVDSLVTGQAVIAKFSEDEAWYRGYIENMTAGQFKVRFTDYGNFDMVGKEALCAPTDEFLKKSSYTVQCKLVGVRPLQAGQWTVDARDIMDGLVKDEVVKCKVLEVSNGYASVKLESKELDVAQELIQTAVVRGVKDNSPEAAAVSTKSSVGVLTFNNQIPLTVGTTEGVFISHTDSVASFWCQPARTVGQLEDLMTQLEVHCKSGRAIRDFPMDMACAAKFSEDESWYRAKVTAAYPDTIEVLFVDYGNTEKVSKSDVCELTEDLVQLPPQAIECELVNSSKASNQLTSKFKELTGEEEVQATVVDILDNSAVVCLTLSSGKNVGEELGLSEPGSNIPVSIKPGPTTPRSESKELYYPKITMPSEPSMVFVTQIINAGEFYVQEADKEKMLNELMVDLSQFCQSREAENVSAPKVGQACCAKFCDDGGWYRAKIVDINGKNCTVEFIDYGNCETTTVDEIKSITDKFVQAAPFVLQCSLEGIVPVGDKWSEESTKKFEDIAVGKDLVCEVVTGSQVVLKCGSTNIAEALLESGLANRAEGSSSTGVRKPVKVSSFRKVTLPEQPSDVYVGHANSPGDFYIQLVDGEEKLNQLMEKLAQLYESSDGLKIDSVSKGQAVCAKYSEDEAWYRAEVIDLEGSKINVLFVDYGNTEETSLANIRELKEEFLTQPPFAIRCELNKVKPVEGDWSEESGVYFETQTTEKVLQCGFVAGTNHVCLKLDGTDVVDLMIEKGYCCKVTEVISPSKQKGQFMPQTVPADSVSCYVSHVDESGTLYVQLACEEDTLNTEVERVQTLGSNKLLDLEVVRKGELVCARFSEDESWYRAVVTGTREGSVKVRFVDYGNCDEVQKADDLRALPEDHQVTPPLAYACTLHGQKQLSKNQIDLLKEVTADKELTVTFLTTSPEYDIQLEDENQQDIGQLLVTAAESQSEEAGDQNQLESTDDVPKDDDHVAKDTEGSSEVPDVNIDAITDKVCDLNKETLAVGQRLNVFVSHAESPSKFWVQIESEKCKLDSLLNTMFDFYNVCSDDKLMVTSVENDTLVAALYDEDESWYRAKVISCDDTEQMKVTFIDHGNTEIISRKSLRKLPTQFTSLPMQGIECCLGGVEPGEENVWSDEVKEVFTQLTADKVLILDVGGIDDNGVYKVQLLDMGMSVGEQLIQKNIGVVEATPVAVSTKVKQVFTPDTNDAVIARLYTAKSSKTLGHYGYMLRDLCAEDPTISTHNVLITSIISLYEFWCRLQDNSYEFYQDKLQESYSNNKEQLADICKGEKCVVYVNDKEYHRGSVVDQDQDGVHVKLVDTGESVIVSQSSVFKLKCDYDSYPQLAFCCSFPGVIAVDTEKQNVQKVFVDTVLELSDKTELPASAKATIVREDKGIILVELTIDRNDIAESLERKGVANIDKTVDLHMLDDDDQIDVSENFGAFKTVQLDIDTDYDVVLIDCSDINRLIFHTVDGVSVMKEIEKVISETVVNKDIGKKGDNLTTGPCLAKSPEDGTWKRANIKSSYQKSEGNNISQTFKVFLVDYGSMYEMPETSILPIPDSVMKIPAQAVVCQLDEIEPVDEEWTEECYDFITEHYMNEDSKLVVYVNSNRKGLHGVFVSSNTKDQGDKSLNHLLIDLGMAAPVIGSQIEMSMLADTAETSFHELSMSRQDSYGDSPDLGKQDGQCVEEKTTDTKEVDDVESDKEDFEDAKETDSGQDVKTSPELSQSTADDSFYDVDEDNKQE